MKYSAFDRELFTINKSVKYYRHIVDGRQFVIYTNHKPLNPAFQQNLDKSSPRQFRHLYFIGQFTADISHMPGQDNVVVHALTRIDELAASTDYDAFDRAKSGLQWVCSSERSAFQAQQ